MDIIDVEGLTKTFRVRQRGEGRLLGRLRRNFFDVRAVDGVSFTIAPGEIVGYIGPNGAGKSTTIKVLTGILVPTSGRVRVAGLEPWRRRTALARRIGVVFGQRTQLWWDLPLRESFELLRHIYRVPRDRHRANLDRYVGMLDMGDFIETPVRQLSLGQRMRGELVAALLHDPEVLYLDEPTIGLDVVAKARIREFLLGLGPERGTTVLLTTHDMGDIERLCRRVLVIDRGELLYDGELENIKERFGRERTVVVDLEEEAPPLSLGNVTIVRADGPRQWLRFDRDSRTAADVIAEVARSARIVDLTVEEPSIEDVVRRMYETKGPGPIA